MEGPDLPVKLPPRYALGKKERRRMAGGPYWGEGEVRENGPHTIYTGSKRKSNPLTVVLRPMPSLCWASVSLSEKGGWTR